MYDFSRLQSWLLRLGDEIIRVFDVLCTFVLVLEGWGLFPMSVVVVSWPKVAWGLSLETKGQSVRPREKKETRLRSVYQRHILIGSKDPVWFRQVLETLKVSFSAFRCCLLAGVVR